MVGKYGAYGLPMRPYAKATENQSEAIMCPLTIINKL